VAVVLAASILNRLAMYGPRIEKRAARRETN
jgi:hypothetical protein